MVTISLCMIVKNEEDTLGRCLDSIMDIPDEIIIVDTGSTDRTKEIARRYSSLVYDFDWVDDFSAARNFSFSKATKEYIFWLDSDDVLLEEDRLKLLKLKEVLNSDIDVVMMKYNLGVDDKGRATCSYFRERLIKRERDFKWYDPVHEYMVFYGKIANVNINVTHKKVHSSQDRNLRIFESIKERGVEFTPRHCYYYARELKFNGRYEEAISYYLKFLDTENGYLSNYIDACIDLSRCYKLMSKSKERLRALLRSFEFDTPHAEVCCEIGFFYKENEDFNKALYWFEVASRTKKPEMSWGSVMHDCYGFTPLLEMGVCHARLGHLEEALRFVNEAGKLKPEDPFVIKNRRILESTIIP